MILIRSHSREWWESIFPDGSERDALFRQNGEQVLNEGLKEKEIRREDDVEQSIWIDPMGQQG